MGELANITMVKEATGSMDQASQIIALSNLTVLSGDDSLTLPLMAIGGRGVISVAGNIVPKDVIALCNAFDAGNMTEALRWHKRLFPALPRHAGTGDQSHSDQGRHANAGTRHRRDAVADDPAGAAEDARLRSTLAGYGLL